MRKYKIYKYHDSAISANILGYPIRKIIRYVQPVWVFVCVCFFNPCDIPKSIEKRSWPPIYAMS
jgi:hypothetical protein